MTEAGGPPLRGLDRLPLAKKAHHLADYVELLCLTSLDGEFSGADLVDRMLERGDVGEDALEDDEAPDPEGTEGAHEDRVRRLAEDMFRHLAYRSDTFGRAYPFRMERVGVLRRQRQMTGQRKLYLFLLLRPASGTSTTSRERLSRMRSSSSRPGQCAAYSRAPLKSTRSARLPPEGATGGTRGRGTSSWPTTSTTSRASRRRTFLPPALATWASTPSRGCPSVTPTRR